MTKEDSVDNITSRAYRPNKDVCCEACVFGRGEHSDWCEEGTRCSLDAPPPSTREDLW